MRTWLARLSFSFLILAGFLGWEAWQGYSGQVVMSEARFLLYGVAAAMSFSLGVAGIRQRHRGP